MINVPINHPKTNSVGKAGRYGAPGPERPRSSGPSHSRELGLPRITPASQSIDCDQFCTLVAYSLEARLIPSQAHQVREMFPQTRSQIAAGRTDDYEFPGFAFASRRRKQTPQTEVPNGGANHKPKSILMDSNLGRDRFQLLEENYWYLFSLSNTLFRPRAKRSRLC
jgi:hypothetical protein